MPAAAALEHVAIIPLDLPLATPPLDGTVSGGGAAQSRQGAWTAGDPRARRRIADRGRIGGRSARVAAERGRLDRLRQLAGGQRRALRDERRWKRAAPAPPGSGLRGRTAVLVSGRPAARL